MGVGPVCWTSLPLAFWSGGWATFPTCGMVPYTGNYTNLATAGCWTRRGSPLLPAKCNTCQTKGSCFGSEQTPGLEWPRPSNFMFGRVITFLGTEATLMRGRELWKGCIVGPKYENLGISGVRNTKLRFSQGLSSHCPWWGGWWWRWKAVLLELWSLVQGTLSIGGLLHSWES